MMYAASLPKTASCSPPCTGRARTPAPPRSSALARDDPGFLERRGDPSDEPGRQAARQPDLASSGTGSRSPAQWRSVGGQDTAAAGFRRDPAIFRTARPPCRSRASTCSPPAICSVPISMWNSSRRSVTCHLPQVREGPPRTGRDIYRKSGTWQHWHADSAIVESPRGSSSWSRSRPISAAASGCRKSPAPSTTPCIPPKSPPTTEALVRATGRGRSSITRCAARPRVSGPTSYRFAQR